MTVPVPWEQLDHAQIYELTQQGPGPGISMDAEAMWQRVAEIVEAGEAAMDRAVRRSEGMWEGSAADGARDGLHVLNSWARDAATDAANTTAAVLYQAEHAGRLRATVPEPDTEQYRAAELLANQNPFDEGMQRGFLAAQDERALRDEVARDKMRDYHLHALENRALMDYWTTPPSVVVTAASAGGGAGAAGGGVGVSTGSAIGDVLNPTAGASGAGVGTGSGAAGGSSTTVPGVGPGAGAVGAGGAGGAGAFGAGAGGAGAGGAGAGGAGAGGARGSGAGGSGAGTVGAGRAGAGGAPGGGSAGTAGSGSLAGTGGAVPAVRGAVPPTGRVPAPGLTGRDALPPGAGGRGPRAAPDLPSSVGGAPRYTTPKAPGTAAPSPTWRDVVAANRVPGAAPPVVPGEPATRPAPGQPGAAAGVPARPGDVRPAAAAGHGGMYPPMTGGTAGANGETRRRAPYLLDDSGVFDVEKELYFVEPIICGTDRER